MIKSVSASNNRTYQPRISDGWRSGLVVGLAVFAALLFWNFPYLTNPPYWDDILGLHNQALWLTKHHFNVVELWKPGQSFWEGGSLVYRFGILPYWYGLLYYLLPPSWVHVTGHLMNIACLAGTCGIFFTITRRHTAFLTALLWCFAALCEPVMAGRSAALGQECPLTLAVALAIYFFSRQRYRFTLCLLTLALLIKMTAVIPLLALLAWLLFLRFAPSGWFATSPHRPCRKLICTTTIIALIAITIMVCVEVDYQFGEWSLSLFNKITVQLPLLVPVQGLTLLVMMIFALQRVFAIANCGEKMTQRDLFAFFLLIMCDGFWTSFLIYSAMLPRYTAMIIFPMFVFPAIMITDKRLSTFLASAFIIFGVINWSGRFMRPLPGAHRRSGEYLERSREYLDDIALNLRACDFLEKHHNGHPVVAKWPFVQMLTLPEMGYVNRPLSQVYDASTVPAKYTGAKRFSDKSAMPPETWYIFVANSFEFWPLFGPPLMPEKGDTVIYRESGLGGFFLIYQTKNRTAE